MVSGGLTLSAQGGYVVSGTVVDQFGPVIGAAVIEQRTSNGTSTGLDGEFSLTVSGPSIFVEISCIGYSTQTYEAASMPQTITMKEDSEHLDEVVVIGYGTATGDVISQLYGDSSTDWQDLVFRPALAT